MHGGVYPREVGAPHGPRVARDGVRKTQLLDHESMTSVWLYWAIILALILVQGHPLPTVISPVVSFPSLSCTHRNAEPDCLCQMVEVDANVGD